MKRIDWAWKGFGLSVYRPNGWYNIYTPIGGVGIDHHRTVTESGISRGRRQEWDLRIPLTKNWQIHLSTNGKDYLTLVQGPQYLRNLSWILDEFDSSFNDLAIASLRYHMDFAVTYCDPVRRARYQDIIDRLSEPRPAMFDPDEKHLQQQLHSLPMEFAINDTPPAIDAVFDRHRDREEARDERINQARHDFVDIMRGLWS